MPPRDIAREVADEDRQKEGWRQWMAQRAEAIHDRVTVYDVLRRNGVKLKYAEREEQISCPFHGKDTNPSARVYPASPRSRSHVWCFVCNQQWDAIALWKKFGGDENIKFGAVLRDMEKEYGIETPEVPHATFDDEPEVNERHLEVLRLFESCENRLRAQRKNLDMVGFLRLGIVVDRLRAQVLAGKIDDAKAELILRQVLDKIGEKVRTCLEG